MLVQATSDLSEQRLHPTCLGLLVIILPLGISHLYGLHHRVQSLGDDPLSWLRALLVSTLGTLCRLGQTHR